jgi:hypothetical protein
MLHAKRLAYSRPRSMPDIKAQAHRARPRINMKTARRQYAAVHEVELESWNRALAVI